MDKTHTHKRIVTGITVVLLLLLYYIIFHFSAQDGERSSFLSQRITQRGVGIANSLSGSRWGNEKVAWLVEYFEHLLRKTAHFSEYACMGILVYLLWSQWMERGRKLYLLTIGWVFLSAMGDEFHQFFVPGRYASPVDVLIDTCGGGAGMLFCIGVAALFGRRRRASRGKKGGAVT